MVGSDMAHSKEPRRAHHNQVTPYTKGADEDRGVNDIKLSSQRLVS